MRIDKKTAFTLIEVLVTLAVILILAGALVGGGKYLKTQAERQLTAGEIEIISTALEQYYDAYKKFPFSNRDIDPTPDGKPDSYTKLHLEWDIAGAAGTVSPASLTMEEKAGDNTFVSYASSAALFYYLDQNKDCRQIIEAIASRLITNKDALTGAALTITIGGTPVDLPRFIDAWGMSLRYEYMSGYSFPAITSAGPDKIFDTQDDLRSP
jgi:prepilin-type N-terminal cleavage/methylation domain-containing protein